MKFGRASRAALAALVSAAVLGTAAVAGAMTTQPVPKTIWCQVPGLGRVFTASTCAQFEEGDVQILALRPGTPYGWTLSTGKIPWVWPRYKGKPLKWPDKVPFAHPLKAIWYGLPIWTGWRFDTGVSPEFVKVLRYAQTRPQPFLFALLAEEMQMATVTPKVAMKLAFAPGAKTGFRYGLHLVSQTNTSQVVTWSLVGGRFLTYSVALAGPYGAAAVSVPQEGVAATRAPTDHGGVWTMTLRVSQADAPMRVNPTGYVTKFGDQVWGTGMALVSLSVRRVGGRWVVTKDGSPAWMGY